jgi:hypothetical protein
VRLLRVRNDTEEEDRDRHDEQEKQEMY